MNTLQLHPIDHRLVAICREILATGWTTEEWSAREADDWFQQPPYEGGFDETEQAFCFSYHPSSGIEYWFLLSLPEVSLVVSGELTTVSMHLAE